MPRVHNKYHKTAPADAVYVGRPSMWGNPFAIEPGTPRDVVIEKYKSWLLDQPDLLAQLQQLKGKDLVCWCFPQACHADILLAMANKQ